jgi:mono/diheme cytochrome c family protein
MPRDYRHLAPSDDHLAAPAARDRGRTVFLMNCAICHGERGDGAGPRQEGLTARPRDFTNPAWRAAITPERVVFTIREGLRLTSMPSWPTLTDDEVRDVAAYVLSLGERP